MFESVANNYFISIFDYNYFLCADLWLAKHPCAMRCQIHSLAVLTLQHIVDNKLIHGNRYFVIPVPQHIIQKFLMLTTNKIILVR